MTQVQVWGVPVEIMSEPGTRKGIRSQRYRVSPDVWVTVHEDGRITFGSYTRHLTVQALINAKGGSALTVTTTSISTTTAAEDTEEVTQEIS